MTLTYSSAASTIVEAFQATVQRHPDGVALRTPGGVTEITWRQYLERVRALTAGFAALGVERGDTVALMMTNRPEFHLIDMALLHLGATPFSIYNSSSPEQITYLFTDSGNKLVVAEEQFIPQLKAGQHGTELEQLVCIDGHPDGTTTLDDVVAKGDPNFDFEASWKAVGPEDVLTLIYTSGTTGDPKGVQLSHRNMLAMVNGTENLLPVGEDDRIISFLPTAHVADRWSAHYVNCVCGNQLTCVSNPKEVLAALTDVRPTVWGGVPQVWQKIKAGIEGKVAEATGVKAKLANWALAVGLEASNARLDGKPVGRALGIQAALADKLVLSKLRLALGLDQVRIALSGAAPISPDVIRFFNGVGIPVCDAWGMSELSGLVTASNPGKVKVGTIGTPIQGVEVKIADDGEILIRGGVVMKGYRNKPEKTAETIDADGWLHTGDIGSLDSEGYVKIVDRKKELIINAGGKNMSPSNIENWVKAFSPLISQAVAIGDDRKYNVALIVLDQDVATAFAAKRGVSSDPAELAANPEILTTIDGAVKQANAKLSKIEQIKKYKVIPDFWEPGSDVLTPTMKLKRKPIDARYGAEIEDLYSSDNRATVS